LNSACATFSGTGGYSEDLSADEAGFEAVSAASLTAAFSSTEPFCEVVAFEQAEKPEKTMLKIANKPNVFNKFSSRPHQRVSLRRSTRQRRNRQYKKH
jgi:hypothetical protein